MRLALKILSHQAEHCAVLLVQRRSGHGCLIRTAHIHALLRRARAAQPHRHSPTGSWTAAGGVGAGAQVGQSQEGENGGSDHHPERIVSQLLLGALGHPQPALALKRRRPCGGCTPACTGQQQGCVSIGAGRWSVSPFALGPRRAPRWRAAAAGATAVLHRSASSRVCPTGRTCCRLVHCLVCLGRRPGGLGGGLCSWRRLEHGLSARLRLCRHVQRCRHGPVAVALADAPHPGLQPAPDSGPCAGGGASAPPLAHVHPIAREHWMSGDSTTVGHLAAESARLPQLAVHGWGESVPDSCQRAASRTAPAPAAAPSRSAVAGARSAR